MLLLYTIPLPLLSFSLTLTLPLPVVSLSLLTLILYLSYNTLPLLLHCYSFVQIVHTLPPGWDNLPQTFIITNINKVYCYYYKPSPLPLPSFSITITSIININLNINNIPLLYYHYPSIPITLSNYYKHYLMSGIRLQPIL